MKVIDPVCRKRIHMAEAAASAEHDGWAYFFCSPACRTAFEAAPACFAERHPRPPIDTRAGVD